ncbi:hypothetical protein Pedsa_3249 [Pseudopedobacter saltans DSM 12145]|uniref:Uncharacterized protein n=1 Tax=Pseudopedobacter saltans (strain ATCC 51119 / DSM 12145 / JCM 21818 / CCUG 39354 / LMG 10337 / NBRC 100064 / NCIMB 13643) TaxID=762903 RepID=F0SBU3_PSESL|nr:hypothetical protein [Pseudopedobacter saltans]ADY53784.1 hypothetical protein Pedsa_3249 [Pseudopedobacter saltans DSM 12145]
MGFKYYLFLLILCFSCGTRKNVKQLKQEIHVEKDSNDYLTAAHYMAKEELNIIKSNILKDLEIVVSDVFWHPDSGLSKQEKLKVRMRFREHIQNMWGKNTTESTRDSLKRNVKIRHQSNQSHSLTTEKQKDRRLTLLWYILPVFLVILFFGFRLRLR